MMNPAKHISKLRSRYFSRYRMYYIREMTSKEIWSNFPLITGSAIVFFYLLAALTGAAEYKYRFLPYSPYGVNVYSAEIPPQAGILRNILFNDTLYAKYTVAREEVSNEAHILGTDSSGRDVLACIIGGATTYLIAGLAAILIFLGAGVLFGAVTGYYDGSAPARATSFLVSVMQSFPIIIVMIIIAFIFDFSFWGFVITFGVIYSSKISHIVSDRVKVLKNISFIEAAKELGLPDLTIIMKHIIWLNCRRELAIQIIYGFAAMILTEATLCYLSLSISGNWISWGYMIYEGVGGRGASHLTRGIYWQFVPPALCIIILIIGLNMLGDGLSRVLGEKEKSNV